MIEISKINVSNGQIADKFALESFREKLTVTFPIVIFLLFTMALALPMTRAAALWMLSENRPVEILTFILLLASGGYGLWISGQLRKNGEKIFYYGFYFLFSLGMIVTAMEEIAWGQQFWGFHTPAYLQEINLQGETTIHNIRGLNGNSEYFRLIFGLGGIIGIALAKSGKFIKISPSIILLTWFLVITAHSLVDVINDIKPIHKGFDAAISRLSELIELIIGAVGFLYLWFNSNKFALSKTLISNLRKISNISRT